MSRQSAAFRIGPIILCVFLHAAAGKTNEGRKTFLLRPDRPMVYLHVDRVGIGELEEDGKRHVRVWLELHNNCALPVSVRTSGAPIGDTADAVSVEEVLVKDDELIISSSQPRESASNVEPMPPTGFFEVSSRHTIPPGGSLRFSLPASHFSKHWTIHIPYQFDLPEGSGPRDDNAWGGQTIMFLSYSFFDLPTAIQKNWNHALAP